MFTSLKRFLTVENIVYVLHLNDCMQQSVSRLVAVKTLDDVGDSAVNIASVSIPLQIYHDNCHIFVHVIEIIVSENVA